MIKTFADNIEYLGGGTTPLERLTIFISNHNHCFIDIEGNYSNHIHTIDSYDTKTYDFEVIVWQNGSAINSYNLECSAQMLANDILNYNLDYQYSLKCFEIKRI